MGKTTNYNNRMMVSIAVVSVITLMLYNLTFSNTLSLISEFSVNESTLNDLENAPNKISLLNKEIIQLNELINIGDSSNTNTKNRIIDFTEQECKNLEISLVELTEPLVQNNGEYNIHYNRLIIEGDYFRMIKFINNLEKKNHSLSLVSVNVFSKKDKYSKKHKIYSEIIFQTIRNEKSKT